MPRPAASIPPGGVRAPAGAARAAPRQGDGREPRDGPERKSRLRGRHLCLRPFRIRGRRGPRNADEGSETFHLAYWFRYSFQILRSAANGPPQPAAPPPLDTDAARVQGVGRPLVNGRCALRARGGRPGRRFSTGRDLETAAAPSGVGPSFAFGCRTRIPKKSSPRTFGQDRRARLPTQTAARDFCLRPGCRSAFHSSRRMLLHPRRASGPRERGVGAPGPARRRASTGTQGPRAAARPEEPR